MGEIHPMCRTNAHALHLPSHIREGLYSVALSVFSNLIDGSLLNRNGVSKLTFLLPCSLQAYLFVSMFSSPSEKLVVIFSR